MKRSKKNNFKKFITSKNIFILVALVLLGLFMLAFSKAKYVANEENTDSYVAKSFYLESDLLNTSGSNAYTYGEGKNAIEFTISNNEDELRFSEVDIEYIATLTDINGTVIKTKTGTLTSGALSKETIRFENLDTGTYEVTVKATSPYTKTLYGTFYITSKDENLSYEVSDTKNSSILYLTINTKDYVGNVLITYPAGVVIDNTNLDIINSTSNTVKIKLEANSEYSLMFFKEDITKVYEKENFTVVKN